MRRERPASSRGPKGIFLAAGVAAALLLPAPQPTLAQSQSQSQSTSAEDRVEIAFWQSIVDSADPADFQAYLDRYGEKATYSALARNRIRALGREKAAAPALEPVAPDARVPLGPSVSAEELVAHVRRALDSFVIDTERLMNAVDIPLGERMGRFRGLLIYVLEVEAMARFVLGPHRRRLTPEQWSTFLALYKELFVSFYSFGSAKNWIGTIALKEVRPFGGDTLVRLDLKPKKGNRLRLDFRVRRVAGGFGFKIVDVILQGVSLVVTQRADFSAILRDRGIDGLSRALAEKIGRPIHEIVGN